MTTKEIAKVSGKDMYVAVMIAIKPETSVQDIERDFETQNEHIKTRLAKAAELLVKHVEGSIDG